MAGTTRENAILAGQDRYSTLGLMCSNPGRSGYLTGQIAKLRLTAAFGVPNTLPHVS
jgi:hypothetical protein